MSETPVAKRNVTLSADEELIEQARTRAHELNTTLNQAFRDWLEQFTRPLHTSRDYEAMMNRLGHIDSAGHFSRDELNER